MQGAIPLFTQEAPACSMSLQNHTTEPAKVSALVLTHGWLGLCFLSSAHILGHLPRRDNAATSRPELAPLLAFSQVCSGSHDALRLGSLISSCPSAVPRLYVTFQCAPHVHPIFFISKFVRVFPSPV